ncbi:MAG TPA: hypothetical protein QGF35_03580 [Dehalococcoidia bacterium]|nr:hypothetical protein [Dehalococcoidia bacterium]
MTKADPHQSPERSPPGARAVPIKSEIYATGFEAVNARPITDLHQEIVQQRMYALANLLERSIHPEIERACLDRSFMERPNTSLQLRDQQPWLASKLQRHVSATQASARR